MEGTNLNDFLEAPEVIPDDQLNDVVNTTVDDVDQVQQSAVTSTLWHAFTAQMLTDGSCLHRNMPTSMAMDMEHRQSQMAMQQQMNTHIATYLRLRRQINDLAREEVVDARGLLAMTTTMNSLADSTKTAAAAISDFGQARRGFFDCVALATSEEGDGLLDSYTHRRASAFSNDCLPSSLCFSLVR